MFPQHLNIRLHLIKQLKLSSNLFFQKNIIFSSLLWLQWLPPKSTTRGNAVRNRCSTYTSTLHNALRNSIFFFFFFSRTQTTVWKANEQQQRRNGGPWTNGLQQLQSHCRPGFLFCDKYQNQKMNIV